MKVSVVIPTVNREKMLIGLLDSLRRQTYKNFEVIIVDQSTHELPRLKAYLQSVELKIKYVKVLQRSLPNARNVGVKNSTGDCILFLDDDEIADPELIYWHIQNYKDKSVMGVGGRMIGGYDKVYEGRYVGKFNRVSGKVYRNFNCLQKQDVEHLSGGNMSFRREIFEKGFFFDTTYGGSSSIGEETDFCLRVSKAGNRLVFEPSAVARHMHVKYGGCHLDSFRDKVFWHSHNSMLFFLRHTTNLFVINFILVRLFIAGLYFFSKGEAVVDKSLCGLLKGVSSYVRTLQKIRS